MVKTKYLWDKHKGTLSLLLLGYPLIIGLHQVIFDLPGLTPALVIALGVYTSLANIILCVLANREHNK